MQKTVVLNVVGLTQDLVGEHTPFLNKWSEERQVSPVGPVLPSVTCPVQATYMTGEYPSEHGIVGNGWYFRERNEIKFWCQSNKLIQSSKIWERARKENPDFTCANLYWWYNMNTTVDYLVTPRPMYPADGRKIPDIYTRPMELRDELQDELGQFPLFQFWGPFANISSTEWCAESAKMVEEKFDPTLTLLYLPHLDYNLQRHGPDPENISEDLNEIDDVCEDIITFYEDRGANVLVLSEYGMNYADNPVSINRTLRRNGYITVRNERGEEHLIPGACRAFAVADHQIAHVYIENDEDIADVRSLLEDQSGIQKILGEEGKNEYHLDHPRSGELVAVSEPDAWFTYYYWLDDDRAPDFAPTVDIHRKPGYDPAELFIDPDITFPNLRIGFRILQKKLGFRNLMDLTPLHGRFIRGSHGNPTDQSNQRPLLIANPDQTRMPDSQIEPTRVYSSILSTIFPNRSLGDC